MPLLPKLVAVSQFDVSIPLPIIVSQRRMVELLIPNKAIRPAPSPAMRIREEHKLTLIVDPQPLRPSIGRRYPPLTGTIRHVPPHPPLFAPSYAAHKKKSTEIS